MFRQFPKFNRKNTNNYNCKCRNAPLTWRILLNNSALYSADYILLYINNTMTVITPAHGSGVVDGVVT